MNQKFLEECVSDFGAESLALYDFKVQAGRGVYHIKIFLDGLEDPRGALRVGQCESFSRLVSKKLDEYLTQVDQAVCQESYAFPKDLSPENYTLEVSSVGAERKLRLPVDLSRFAGQLLYIRYYDSDQDRDMGKIQESRCIYCNTDESLASYEFVTQPTTRKKPKSKKNQKKNFQVKCKNLIEARLQIEF